MVHKVIPHTHFVSELVVLVRVVLAVWWGSLLCGYYLPLPPPSSCFPQTTQFSHHHFISAVAAAAAASSVDRHCHRSRLYIVMMGLWGVRSLLAFIMCFTLLYFCFIFIRFFLYFCCQSVSQYACIALGLE